MRTAEEWGARGAPYTCIETMTRRVVLALTCALLIVGCEEMVVKEPSTLVGGGGPAGEAPPDELPPPHPVLPTPTAPSASQASVTFTFSQPTGAGSDRVQNVETFGYEVYYRFSAVGESTERNLQDRAQLDASGFVSLRKADDRHPIGVTERPLIVVAVAARADHRVTLGFAALQVGDDPHVTLSSGGRISVRRGVAGGTTTGLYQQFVCEAFQPEHADVEAYPELAQDCAGLLVQLQLYAVAYGRDADRREQFSDALYLGSIDLTFRG